MQRIVVVGSSNSGKTTLSRQLARRLNVPCVELDALFWEPGWSEASLEVFRDRVSHALRGDAWVVDGSYLKVRDLTWGRADTLVWLDPPLPVVLWRLVGRTLRRIARGEELWSGNRETLRNAVFSRDSLFLYALRTHRARRRAYTAALTRPECAHLTVVRLRSTSAVRAWLASNG